MQYTLWQAGNLYFKTNFQSYFWRELQNINVGKQEVGESKQNRTMTEAVHSVEKPSMQNLIG